MKKTVAYSARIAAMSAALAMSGAAFAATAAPATMADAIQVSAATDVQHDGKRMHKKGPHHHRHGHHQMRDAAMWVPGYGPLNKDFVDTLALSPEQLELVEAAKAEQKAGRGERRDAMKAARQSRLEQLKRGTLDPAAALKQKQEGMQKAHEERRKVDEKWLAVWDKLDDGQQKKVAAHFNERAEKFAKRAEQRKAHKAKPAIEQAAS